MADDALPLLPPKQNTLVVPLMEMEGALASVTLTVVEAIHPLASVTVTE